MHRLYSVSLILLLLAVMTGLPVVMAAETNMPPAPAETMQPADFVWPGESAADPEGETTDGTGSDADNRDQNTTPATTPRAPILTREPLQARESSQPRQ